MAEEQQQFSAAKFARLTKRALEFYQKGASEEEKKVVAKAISKAAKSIKKELRGKQEGDKEKQARKGAKQASPEDLAAGLFKVLSESATARVKGDPSRGAQTEIQGTVDLNEAARKLLSPAP